MTHLADWKYRAFISYSHKDRAWGEWVQRDLERYRVPRVLVGRETGNGPIPRSLNPIFRDRVDLAAAYHIDDKIRGALEATSHLIVVCSPNSAASDKVNEEILLFKRLGRGDRILPLIVGGEPNDSVRECFPRALRYKIDGHGNLTDERDVEPLAADAREEGDGKSLALLKLVAGLLGVELDEVRRRDAAEKQRQTRFYAGLSLAMGVLAIAAMAGGYISFAQYQAKNDLQSKTETLLDRTLYRAVNLVDNSIVHHEDNGLPVSVTEKFVADAKEIIGEGEAFDVDQLNEPLRARTARGHASIVFARLASKVGRTEEHERLAREAVGVFEALIAGGHGWLDWEYELSEARLELGHALMSQSKFDEALREYTEAVAMKERLVADMPDDAGNRRTWQRTLAFSKVNVGGALLRRTRTKEAIVEIDKGLKELDALRESEPGDWTTGVLRLQSIILKADAMRTDKLYAPAFDVARQGLGEADAMIKRRPGSVLVKRRRAELLQVLGDAAAGKKSSAEALEYYEAYAEAYSELVERDPENTSYQSSANFGRIKLGEIAAALENKERALEEFRIAAEGYERLIELRPDKSTWRKNLSYAYAGLANLHRAEGEYDKAMAIREKEVATFRQGGMLGDAARTTGEIGDLHADMGDYQKALAAYTEALDVRTRMLAGDPRNEVLQRGVALLFGRRSDAFRKSGAFEPGLRDANDSRALRERLLAAAPSDALRLSELAAAERRVGEVHNCMRSATEAREALDAARGNYSKALEIEARAEWKKAADEISALLAQEPMAVATCAAAGLAQQ